MIAQWIRKSSGKAPVGLLRWMGNFWPPYLGAGVRIDNVSQDFRTIKVRLKSSWWNKNYVGTQFGGSIYAMVDPFFMMMIMNNLGKEYIVWDRAAKIEFLRPGRSELFAEFKIDADLLDQIIRDTSAGNKLLIDLPVTIFDDHQEKIAEVIKTIYIRKKQVLSNGGNL